MINSLIILVFYFFNRIRFDKGFARIQIQYADLILCMDMIRCYLSPNKILITFHLTEHVSALFAI